MIKRIKRAITFLLISGVIMHTQAQITLQTDYTNKAYEKGIIPYHLNIYNRITPINGFNAPHTKENTKLCIVRPLGGIASKGKANLTTDSYKWDADAGNFRTDFTLLKKQMVGVFQEDLGIYHLVLDNPSWAFQRAADGSLSGDTLKVSTYGNAEPPRDYQAWATYLKQVMTFLVDSYGENEVVKIQFGVGREIGTPTHWSGSQEQFFKFYKISVEAIHSVLPKAKVGTHFLWGSSKKAWGTDFVKWAKLNHVPYDFVGVSYYPFYDKPGRINFNEVYLKDFGVIKDIPEWNEKARLEMHEFALIESMAKLGNAFRSANKAHQNSFMVGLMKMFYENNMYNVFQWGDGRKYKPASTELKKLEGHRYYSSTKTGSEKSDTNYVDAIFTKDTAQHQYSIMAYNYSANPASDVSEELNIVARIDAPSGTTFKYRSAMYGPLNNTLDWSDWQETSSKGTLSDKSTITFNTQLPAFSFLTFEIWLMDDIQ